MLMLIALLVPLVILASWHDAEHSKRSVPVYFALLLALESTMIGVFAAADVFLFYVFFEVMLVPMYFIIGSYGTGQRQYAAVKFFLYSLVGGLFMLVLGIWAFFAPASFADFVSGVLLPVLLVTIVLLSSNREIMGEYANSALFKIFAWLITIIVSILSLMLIGKTIIDMF